MNPKQFLQIGGAVLVLVGILGYIGIIGPTPDKSIFQSMWWFDDGENLAHTVLGVVGIAASFVLSSQLQRYLVMLLAALGIVVGLYNFGSMNLLGSNLESPADLLLHLAVGGWALYASVLNKSAVAAK